MVWPNPLEALRLSHLNLESLIFLHYSFRGWDFRLINLEDLTILAYSFRDSKKFAFLI